MDTLDESFWLAASQLGLVLPPTVARASVPSDALVRFGTLFSLNVNAIKGELRRRQQRWLTIFDGADDLLLGRCFYAQFWHRREYNSDF